MRETQPCPHRAVSSGLAVSPSIPLVLLAAGLGSRYGGVKPLAPVGPTAEPLLLIALRHAADAGFTEAVVVTSAATRGPIEAALNVPLPLAVRYADQGMVGPAREKPWGTVAGVLAADAGDRFVSANGDDLYGAEALRPARWYCDDGPSGTDAAMIGYRLDRTLSRTAGVSRAVSEIDRNGLLSNLVEHRDVQREGARVRSSTGASIAPETTVSMNLWAFRAPAVAALRDELTAFLDANRGSPTAELGLPQAIGRLAHAGTLRVAVYRTSATWHGVTWAEDVAVVRAALTAELAGR